MKGTGQPQVGFVAQEMKRIVPEVVEGKEGSMGISYGNLVAVAFQAIKDLAHKVEGIFTSLVTHKITTDEITTEKLCVGATCVTEIQLRALLEKGNVATVVAPVTPPVVPPEATTTPVVEVPPVVVDPPVVPENISDPCRILPAGKWDKRQAGPARGT